MIGKQDLRGLIKRTDNLKNIFIFNIENTEIILIGSGHHSKSNSKRQSWCSLIKNMKQKGVDTVLLTEMPLIDTHKYLGPDTFFQFLAEDEPHFGSALIKECAMEFEHVIKTDIRSLPIFLNLTCRLAIIRKKMEGWLYKQSSSGKLPYRYVDLEYIFTFMFGTQFDMLLKSTFISPRGLKKIKQFHDIEKNLIPESTVGFKQGDFITYQKFHKLSAPIKNDLVKYFFEEIDTHRQAGEAAIRTLTPLIGRYHDTTIWIEGNLLFNLAERSIQMLALLTDFHVSVEIFSQISESKRSQKQRQLFVTMGATHTENLMRFISYQKITPSFHHRRRIDK